MRLVRRRLGLPEENPHADDPPPPVAFACTRLELRALCCYAQEHDVERGGPTTRRVLRSLGGTSTGATQREASEILGAFDVHWVPTPMLYEIETDVGFSLEGLQQGLGMLELKALRPAIDDVPQKEGT